MWWFTLFCQLGISAAQRSSSSSPSQLLSSLTSPAASSISSSTTSSYVEPSVPTGTPVPGNYTGPLRPQVHFSPPQHFMNDPNGMFYDNVTQTWHLYYQYNPTGVVAGNQHWGHATSRDLYHWTNQPIALFALNESSYIFSGSAVVDVNNTSGFFPGGQTNGVVAVFTIATYEPILLQTQGLAYSRDGGYTFTMYAGNPVLDVGSSQFRDPKVIWYQDHWVMVVSYAANYTIGIFTSKDLKAWQHASNVSDVGLLGVQYECPNLVEMPFEPFEQQQSNSGTGFGTGNITTNGTMWVLQVSINPGAPLGGSISQAFLGQFDGYTFTLLDRAARINDWGKDNYAGQFFYGLPPTSDAVSIGWASNWQYAQQVPTGPLENWRSAMSLPRRNTVRQISRSDYVLTSQPVSLGPVLGAKLASKPGLTNGSIALDFSSAYSNALYFEANITNSPTAGTLNFTFMSPISGEALAAGCFLGAANPAFINRGRLRGFDQVFFTDKTSVNMVNGVTNVAGVIDRSLFELFLNNGERSATTSFYSTEPLTIMSVAVAGLTPANASVSLAVWELKSTWLQYENAEGTVLGNTTASSNSSQFHRRQLYRPVFQI